MDPLLKPNLRKGNQNHENILLTVIIENNWNPISGKCLWEYLFDLYLFTRTLEPLVGEGVAVVEQALIGIFRKFYSL